jgi:hypothetical protein
LGNWFGLRFEDIGPVTVAEYRMGQQLNEIVKSGSARAAAPISDAA